MKKVNDSKIIIALDYDNAETALSFVDLVDPNRCQLKIGKELFLRTGPEFVKMLVARNFNIFLDLKFHDIPNTVAQACIAAAELGVWMFNIHCLGGEKMITAAVEAVASIPGPKPILLGVTVLTSLSQTDLPACGIRGGISENVLRLAALSQQTGLDGVVCSAREAAMLRDEFGRDFCLVTPGIRPEQAKLGDQSRTVTPVQAINLGVDYMVIGRPITQAADPMRALAAIEDEINNA